MHPEPRDRRHEPAVHDIRGEHPEHEAEEDVRCDRGDRVLGEDVVAGPEVRIPPAEAVARPFRDRRPDPRDAAGEVEDVQVVVQAVLAVDERLEGREREQREEPVADGQTQRAHDGPDRQPCRSRPAATRSTAAATRSAPSPSTTRRPAADIDERRAASRRRSTTAVATRDGSTVRPSPRYAAAPVAANGGATGSWSSATASTTAATPRWATSSFIVPPPITTTDAVASRSSRSAGSRRTVKPSRPASTAPE